jgi:ligand-binding sensor domain-containing protein
LFLNIICTAQQRQVIINQVTLKNEIFGKITGLTQDQQGYMWIATNDGLYRYDRVNDVYYKHDPSDTNSIARNDVSCICTDKQGNICLGVGDSGFDILDPVTGIYKHFRHDAKNKNSLINNYVIALAIDYDGTLWIGTLGGLDHFNYKTGKFTHYTHSDTDSLSLSNNHIQTAPVLSFGKVMVLQAALPL